MLGVGRPVSGVALVAKGTKRAAQILRGKMLARSASSGRVISLHATGRAIAKVRKIYAKRYASVIGSSRTGHGSDGPQPRPRGPLFTSDDPTLAKRFEEELHGFGR